MTEKLKILLVDDEQDILDILAYNLKKEGYHVFTAENGAEGVLIAKECTPDLVILDYMMPVMDGLQTCLTLKEISALKHTKVVMLSARSESELVRNAFKYGVSDYIAKPISPSLFITKVRNLLAS